jgi:hypothetical protein
MRARMVRVPRAVTGLLVALALLALPSCMSVPDSGPVLAGPAVGSDDEPVLRYVPDGPQPGADPVEIINGYLDAMRAYPANPEVVRQFLTRRAGASWTPGSGTRIYATGPELERLDRDVVRIDTELVARLSERGSWSPPGPDERRLRQVFRLQRQRGEWRISNPADGLLVPEYDFERYYRAYSLYFFDPARRVLVPDPVAAAAGAGARTDRVAARGGRLGGARHGPERPGRAGQRGRHRAGAARQRRAGAGRGRA